MIYSKYLIIILLFVITIDSFSQIENSKIISVKYSNTQLRDVIKDISKKTGILFTYSTNFINDSIAINYKAKNKNVNDILNDILTSNSIKWKTINEQIVLTKETNIPKQNNKYTISGFVKDKNTGEFLVGASVYFPQIHSGTISNSYGFYSITVIENNYNLCCSYIGYSNIQIFVNLKRNINLDILLTPLSIKLVEISIKATDVITTFDKNTSGELTFNKQNLTERPSPMAEQEIIKSVQTFPGVSSIGDASAYYFVRGGQKDQNLILVDDAPVFNPSHLLGMFSSFVPEAVKSFSFYKSYIPPKFGDKLSSVLDIVTNDGNKNCLSGNVGVGPAAFHLQLEGPFKKDTSSWFFSIRRSNINWIFKKINQNLDVGFTDFNTKTNFRLGDKNRLFFSMYIGKDNFYQKNNDYKYGLEWLNFASTIRVNHIYNEKTFSNTTINLSKYNYNFYFSRNSHDYWNNYIQTFGIKHDITNYYNTNNSYNFGLGINFNVQNPGNVNLTNNNSRQIIPIIAKCYNNDIYLYTENQRKINNYFSVNFGLRLPIFFNNGPTTEYFFDENYNYKYSVDYLTKKTYNYFFIPEPRFLIKYMPDTFFNVSFVYNKTIQFIRQIGTSQSPFSSLEVWLPSSPGLEPEKANQFSLIISKLFTQKNITINIEPYYKILHNVTDYKEHANLLINPLIKGELILCGGNSYGIETSVKKNSDKILCEITYAYSKSFLQSDFINSGKKYLAYYDRTNVFNVNLLYKINNRLTVSSNWIFSTGTPVTVPTGYYYYQDNQIPYYSEKNNSRLPNYHRLDFSLEYILNKQLKKSVHKLNIVLYNIYNRKNPFELNFNKMINGENKFVIPQNNYDNVELTPSYKYLFGFIPSISYIWQF